MNATTSDQACEWKSSHGGLLGLGGQLETVSNESYQWFGIPFAASKSSFTAFSSASALFG